MDLTALAKLQRYCAYQERCHQEVRSKLLKLKIYGTDLEDIVAELIATGFLNEGRFAEAYVRGKFRNNHWGKVKIRRALGFKGVSAFDIDRALNLLDEQEYRDKLAHLLQKKSASLGDEDSWTKRQKLLRFASQKGYETAEIQDVLCDMGFENRP